MQGKKYGKIKLQAIVYMRSPKKRGGEEINSQRKTCQEAARVLGIEIVKFFWEIKNNPPSSPAIRKEMLEYSIKNKIYIWLAENPKQIISKEEDLATLLKKLERNRITLLFIKPYYRSLYFSNAVIALKLFGHELKNTENKIYLQELKRELTKPRKKQLKDFGP